MEFVIPGHYISNVTIDSEVNDIIRVLGPSPNQPGMWIIDNGKMMHESMIVNSYTLLDTAATEKENNNNSMRKLLGDFEPIITDVHVGTVAGSTANNVIIHHPTPTHSVTTPELTIQTKPIVIAAEKPRHYTADSMPIIKPNLFQGKLEAHPFTETGLNLIELFEKANIDNLNKSSNKKYGIEPYKPSLFDINFQIKIDYDLHKVIQICELFDIEIDDALDIIIKKSLTDNNDSSGSNGNYQQIINGIVSDLKQQIKEASVQNQTQTQSIQTQSQPTPEPTTEHLVSTSKSYQDSFEANISPNISVSTHQSTPTFDLSEIDDFLNTLTK